MSEAQHKSHYVLKLRSWQSYSRTLFPEELSGSTKGESISLSFPEGTCTPWQGGLCLALLLSSRLYLWPQLGNVLCSSCFVGLDRTHLTNPGSSIHLKVLNLNQSAKSQVVGIRNGHFGGGHHYSQYESARMNQVKKSQGNKIGNPEGR